MSVKTFSSLMIVILISYIFTILVTLSWPMDQTEVQTQQEKQEKIRLESITANMESLDYWIDTATGICYARLWAGMASGGPALAAVPCEKLTDPTPFNSEK